MASDSTKINDICVDCGKPGAETVTDVLVTCAHCNGHVANKRIETEFCTACNGHGDVWIKQPIHERCAQESLI